MELGHMMYRRLNLLRRVICRNCSGTVPVNVKQFAYYSVFSSVSLLIQGQRVQMGLILLLVGLIESVHYQRQLKLPVRTLQLCV